MVGVFTQWLPMGKEREMTFDDLWKFIQTMILPAMSHNTDLVELSVDQLKYSLETAYKLGLENQDKSFLDQPVEPH